MEERVKKHALLIKRRRIEVSEEIYKAYYKLTEREKYLDKLAGQKNLSLEECEEKGIRVEYALLQQEPIEDKLVREEMLSKLSEAIKMLTEQERVLIHELFFKGISERKLALKTGIPLMTINDRKRRILKKLKRLIEK